MKIFIILGIFSVTAMACTKKQTFARHFAENLSAPEFNEFRLESQKTLASSTQTEFSSSSLFLLVKSSPVADVDSKNAAQFLQSQLDAILQIYSTHETPYAGILSKNVNCAEEYLPQEVKSSRSGVWLRAVELHANERRIFGSCSSATAKYKALYLALLCTQQKKFYEIILFTPKEQRSLSTQKIIETLSCI